MENAVANMPKEKQNALPRFLSMIFRPADSSLPW